MKAGSSSGTAAWQHPATRKRAVLVLSLVAIIIVLHYSLTRQVLT